MTRKGADDCVYSNVEVPMSDSRPREVLCIILFMEYNLDNYYKAN